MREDGNTALGSQVPTAKVHPPFPLWIVLEKQQRLGGGDYLGTGGKATERCKREKKAACLGGFDFLARVNSESLTSKPRSQVPALRTKKGQEPGAQGVRGSHPAPPHGSAPRAGLPGSSGQRKWRQRSWVPDALFWWRAPLSPPSQTHTAFSAAPSPGASWWPQQGNSKGRARVPTAPDPGGRTPCSARPGTRFSPAPGSLPRRG